MRLIEIEQYDGDITKEDDRIKNCIIDYDDIDSILPRRIREKDPIYTFDTRVRWTGRYGIIFKRGNEIVTTQKGYDTIKNIIQSHEKEISSNI